MRNLPIINILRHSGTFVKTDERILIHHYQGRDDASLPPEVPILHEGLFLVVYIPWVLINA